MCSVMGHDAAIQDLVKHYRGLGLFHSLDTMEKMQNRVLTLVSELKDSSLLLVCSNVERFDMHDVVCDVAITIASRDHRWLALGQEDVFEEWSNEDTMRNYSLISLHYAKVSELPDEFNCLNLTFFSMHGCGLEDIVILGELRNLEILDLCGSVITMLPKEIGQLTRLKLLDLSNCSYLKVISPNVLSNLSRFKELYLYLSFYRLEVEGIENPRRNASLDELQHLSCLTTLEVHIPNVEAIPKDNLFLEKMERYKISIGNEEWSLYCEREMKTSRILKLKISKSIHLVNEIHKLLSRKIESLHLDRVEVVREMFYDPNVESFRQLRFIKVLSYNMLKNLFPFHTAKRLLQLEELEVCNCENITELVVEKEEIDENDILKFI
ncbi:hypothetical protein V6N12_057481 [Hibiscus sabdariffa]|uniref:Disease resistance protein At4g27190-like leucine-rich repeats domain-containing protein n=1 Tax=Hibiscus sabdariffa TaxID=183260 RepID=A0ABR2C581_9ROSI